jgi:hypothetical protein
MKLRINATAVVTAAALLLPVTAFAQSSPEQPPAEIQEWITEMQQIQARLEPVQDQALQDSELQLEQQQIGEAVRGAMVAANPAVAAQLERMEALLEEARAAQAAADTDRIVALTAEAQELQTQLAEAQAEALQQPEIEARVEAFQKNLQERMVQIDPESRALLDRLQELDRRVRAAIGSLG